MEITEHQANMLRALADGKKLEAVHEKTAPGKWFEIQTLDNFMLFISSPDWYEVRIKPDVIVVNGVEVPAPEKSAPPAGTECFFPNPAREDWVATTYWEAESHQYEWLNRGLVYTDRTACELRSKAMAAHMPG